MVALSFLRSRLLSARTRLSSASATVSDFLVRPIAARAALRTKRSTPGKARLHAASRRITVQLGLGFLVADVIGLDNAGHKLVAYDVP